MGDEGRGHGATEDDQAGQLRHPQQPGLDRREVDVLQAQATDRAAGVQPRLELLGRVDVHGPIVSPTLGSMSDGAYARTYARSLDDPQGFWLEAAADIDWVTPPRDVLDESRPPFYRWFPGATLNTCFNALDRHVAAGRGDQVAVHYDSPVTGTKRSITYAELLADVRRLAGALRGAGVEKGDRVVIYLPMVPEAVAAMLACARIGAVHSVVFGGFAPAELAARIDDAQPKVVLTASCGIEPNRVVEYKPMLDAAIERASHRPELCVVLQREQARAALGESDIEWGEFVSSPAADAGADCVEVAATDPLYILYTSGTTGKPKGIVRDNGGHAVALRWSMEHVFGVHPGETWFTASDVGWVVGHSYIVYAPLLTGCTTVLYEGKPVGTPDAGAFFRLIGDYGAVAMFTAPTAYRAIKKEDAAGEAAAAYDLSTLRTLFLAGERLDPDTWRWASDRLGVPVVDNWWQTETGWPIAADPMGLEPSYRSSPARPRCRCPGMPSPSWTSAAGRCLRAPRAPSACACRCRRAPCPRCGTTTSATSLPTCRRSRATT